MISNSVSDVETKATADQESGFTTSFNPHSISNSDENANQMNDCKFFFIYGLKSMFKMFLKRLPKFNF